ncbi:hypothetical protein FA15DRAFT_675298 [Coprinopsis marcescibilis]|uniref:Uncharacterized protein n=1 Tax=Coprinopsis marcescibilis TaxID=230819 RepID=A0A5C3KEP1_COPMA|nr:hypothetical protein FA15DRAFT_675298 [Coprinopsis marcescibilis]
MEANSREIVTGTNRFGGARSEFSQRKTESEGRIQASVERSVILPKMYGISSTCPNPATLFSGVVVCTRVVSEAL